MILTRTQVYSILKKKSVKKWLANGAQPTETVGKLLKIAGIEK